MNGVLATLREVSDDIGLTKFWWRLMLTGQHLSPVGRHSNRVERRRFTLKPPF